MLLLLGRSADVGVGGGVAIQTGDGSAHLLVTWEVVLQGHQNKGRTW